MNASQATNDPNILTKEKLLRGAAFALLLDGEIAARISKRSTAEFVQETRRTWRENGWNFSDGDLRFIHEELRRLVQSGASGPALRAALNQQGD